MDNIVYFQNKTHLFKKLKIIIENPQVYLKNDYVLFIYLMLD